MAADRTTTWGSAWSGSDGPLPRPRPRVSSDYPVEALPGQDCWSESHSRAACKLTDCRPTEGMLSRGTLAEGMGGAMPGSNGARDSPGPACVRRMGESARGLRSTGAWFVRFGDVPACVSWGVSAAFTCTPARHARSVINEPKARVRRMGTHPASISLTLEISHPGLISQRMTADEASPLCPLHRLPQGRNFPKIAPKVSSAVRPRSTAGLEGHRRSVCLPGAVPWRQRRRGHRLWL